MIGYIAACLTTFGFLPQMIKVLKTKDVESISLQKIIDRAFKKDYSNRII